MSTPVITVASGGLPVIDVAATTPKLGLPVTEAPLIGGQKYGIAVTKVAANGLPVTFEGLSPPLDALAATVMGAYSVGRPLFSSFNGARIVGSGTVSSWINQKAGGAPAFDQATTAYQPTLVNAGPKNVPALDFIDGAPGTGNSMQSGFTSNHIVAASGYIVVSFIADVIDANTTIYYNECLLGDSGANLGIYLKAGDTINSYMSDGASKTSAVAVTEGLPYVVEWRHEAGTLYLRVNGETETSVAAGNTAGISSVFRIGSWQIPPTIASSLDGKIFEIVTFATVPTLAERNALVANMKSYVGA